MVELVDDDLVMNLRLISYLHFYFIEKETQEQNENLYGKFLFHMLYFVNE